MRGLLARLRRSAAVRRVRPREDYRRFSTARRQWGNSVFWWPSDRIGERACIFGRTPRVGDVLEDDGWLYVITEAEQMRDPRDQSFVSVRLLGREEHYRLPPSTDDVDYVF